MNILHLTLKKRWFDMIERGEKPEEYREIKDYWCVRLLGRHYDAVHFRNGYSKNARTMLLECGEIVTGIGNPEWGAPNKPVFIIKLGAQFAD